VVSAPQGTGTRSVVKTLRPTLLACLALLTLAPPALAQSGVGMASPSATHTQLARFGGFGGRGFGARGRGFGSRSRGFRPHRGRSIFRSIVRALAIGYLLHLLFTTPGGLLVLVLMILGVVLLMSRFRRRRALRY
jgi:Flp pilus assembly protein TadB